MALTTLPYRQFAWRFIVMTATVLLGMALIACVVGCKRHLQPKRATMIQNVPHGCVLRIGEDGEQEYQCWSTPYPSVIPCPKNATCVE